MGICLSRRNNNRVCFWETITPDIVNYDGNYPYGNSPNGINREKPVAVGSLGRANRWGLSDMHGNVWEWCEDVYHDNYIGAPTDGSAWLTPRSDGKNYRLLRGGSLGSYARYCRSAGRNRVEAGNHGNQFGFRVVAVLRTTPSVVASPPTTAQPKEPNPPPKTNPTDTNPAPAPRDAEKKREPAEVQIEMVRIPVEKFLMGSPPNEQGREDERPQREVTITNSFYMSKYEVTQAEWRAVSALPKVSIDLPSNPSKFRGDNLPVEQVSWEDAVEFCERLSRATRKNYRLPTEAEWEYACRAGATEMYAGNLDAMAWYIANSGNTTHPVGQKQPNRFGLYDMYGNVFEWCRDLYDENYYLWGPKVDPLGPATGLNRVGRGGAWSSDAAVLRAAFRGKDVPSFRSDFLGFRVVRTSN